MKYFVSLMLLTVCATLSAQRQRVDSIWTAEQGGNLFLVQRLVDREGNYTEQGSNLGPVASVDTASIINNLKNQSRNAWKREASIRREMVNTNAITVSRMNEAIAAAFGIDLRQDTNDEVGEGLKTVPDILFLRDSVPVNGWRLVRYNNEKVGINMDLTTLTNGSWRFVNVTPGWADRILYAVILRDNESIQVNFGDGFRIFHYQGDDDAGQLWMCSETNDVLRKLDR